MPNEVYTPCARAPNLHPPPVREPQRAGELLPELFRSYVERVAAAAARPAVLGDDQRSRHQPREGAPHTPEATAPSVELSFAWRR